MDMLLNTRDHGNNNRFSTLMIFCVFCIQLFTEAVPMTNVDDPSKIQQYTTSKDNLTLYNASNTYQENSTSSTEYSRMNSVQRTDNVLSNKTATTMTSTIENISTSKDINLLPSKVHAKFDPMAAVLSNLLKPKRNFNQYQCKGVYEPVLISAGLMKPHLSSDLYVSQESAHEPSVPKGVQSSPNSNTTNNSTNTSTDTVSENGNINHYDNSQSSESENKIDYYGDTYYGEAYYGYYDDYYYDDEPEECCKRYGVSEDCLGLCLGDRVFDCSMLCKYMFGHIARTCMQNLDKLLKNEYMPLYG